MREREHVIRPGGGAACRAARWPALAAVVDGPHAHPVRPVSPSPLAASAAARCRSTASAAPSGPPSARTSHAGTSHTGTPASRDTSDTLRTVPATGQRFLFGKLIDEERLRQDAAHVDAPDVCPYVDTSDTDDDPTDDGPML